MAEAIIGPLVGRLQEVAVGEARALVGVNADIHRLRDKLMWLQAFLREADTRRRAVTDEVTRVWTLQTRDAVFDAEDALDHYHLHVDMSRYPRWARPTMICLETFTIQVRMRRGLSRKIRAINMRLDGIIENKDKYKIEDSNKKTDVTWKPSTSTSINYTHRKLDDVHDSDAVIYVEEHNQLEEALVNNLTEHQEGKEHYPVMITVSGESGIGKTTLIEAHEASFVEVHSHDDIPTLTSARRLSLQNYTDKYAVLAHPLPKLRSIFSQYEQEPNKGDQGHRSKGSRAYMFHLSQRRAISKMKKDIRSHIKELFHGSEFLRVINLQGIEIGETLTSAIGNVVHLQYLGITSCSLKHIPRSIGRLTSLQTLDVRETNVRELPRSFWMIKTLRHVLGFVLRLPKQIGNLKQLHTLDSIDLEEVSEKLTLERTLGEMIHLEFLSIWHISHVNVKALSGALDKLESLRTLILEGKIIPSNVFTTASLRRVKFMFLSGDLVHSSDLDGSESFCLPNLIMLSLEKTYVTQEFISKLSQLPFLAILALYPGSYKDKKLVFASSKFPRLKKIKMIDVEVLEIVEVEVSMVPELKELEIHSPFTGCYHDIDLGNDKKRSQKTRIVVDLKKENNDVHEENDDV
ncbi:unnamed protein product [Miscanthus lutarioriparius]|uniref:Rx N-terminal domain-containing protein n=1 Tax=Miscanthus lutarioriparius TaxID=422564 RepID=A0A811REL5_9POAL|nr:unnamed protein product [Miscanthus lutarioriparius]